MGDVDLLDRFTPTRSRLMKLDLQRYIMSRDQATRATALDMALMLLYHEDSLVIEDITTDVHLKSIIVWTERKRTYRSGLAMKNQIAELQRNTTRLLTEVAENTGAIARIESGTAAHARNVDGLTRAYQTMSENVTLVQDVLADFKTAVRRVDVGLTSLTEETRDDLSQCRNAIRAGDEALRRVGQGLEHLTQKTETELDDVRRAVKTADDALAAHVGAVEAELHQALDVQLEVQNHVAQVDRGLEHLTQKTEMAADDIRRGVKTGDEALSGRLGGVERDLKRVMAKQQDMGGQVNNLTGTLSRQQLSLEGVVEQNKESMKVAKAASSKLADVSQQTQRMAADLRGAQEASTRHEQTIGSLTAQTRSYDAKLTDVYTKSSQLLNSTQAELQRSQRKINQTQAFLSTQADDKLDELTRGRGPASPSVSEVDTKLRALQWVARNSAWMDSDKISRSVVEFTTWAGEHPAIMRDTPAQVEAIEDCTAALTGLKDTLPEDDADYAPKLAVLLRLLKCILLSDASNMEIARQPDLLKHVASHLRAGAPEVVACAALEVLTEAFNNEQSCRALLSTQLLDRILDLLQTGGEAGKVAAVRVIRHIARHDVAIEMLSSHRVTGQIVALLKGRLPDGPLLDQLCASLRNLCRADTVVVQIDRAGGIDALISLLNSAVDGSERHKHVTATLRSCSKNMNVQRTLKERGILEALGIRYPLIK